MRTLPMPVQGTYLMDTETSEVCNRSRIPLTESAGAIRVRVQPDTNVTSAPSRIVIAPVLDFGPVVLACERQRKPRNVSFRNRPVASAWMTNFVTPRCSRVRGGQNP